MEGVIRSAGMIEGTDDGVRTYRRADHVCAGNRTDFNSEGWLSCGGDSSGQNANPLAPRAGRFQAIPGAAPELQHRRFQCVALAESYPIPASQPRRAFANLVQVLRRSYDLTCQSSIASSYRERRTDNCVFFRDRIHCLR